MSAKYALMLSLAATLLAPSRGFAATTAAAPLPPQPVLRADEGDDEGEHKKEDDAAEKAKKKDPSDVRNAIGNLSLVRDMAKLAKPKKDGLWEQLVDQPYFTDEVRARKLLFHGQYDRAETEFAGLLKRDPKNPEYLQGQLEAILRQGKQANVKRFEEQLAALPKELQDSAKVVHLRVENMLEKGQVSEARALLKGFVDNHTKLLPADGDVLSVYNQYGEVLEQEAQYSSAVVTYQKVVDLAKENLPDDSLINTQIALAVHRVSVLTGKGKAMHRTVLAMLDAVVNKDKAYWPAYLLQAQILMESHNTKEGGEAINETLGLNPNNLDARYLARSKNSCLQHGTVRIHRWVARKSDP